MASETLLESRHSKHRRSSDDEDTDKSSKRHKHRHHKHHKHHRRHSRSKKNEDDAQRCRKDTASPPSLPVGDSKPDDDVEEGEILEEQSFAESLEKKWESDAESGEIKADDFCNSNLLVGDDNHPVDEHVGNNSKTSKISGGDRAEGLVTHPCVGDKSDVEVTLLTTCNVDPQNHTVPIIVRGDQVNGDLGCRFRREDEKGQRESGSPSKRSGKRKGYNGVDGMDLDESQSSKRRNSLSSEGSGKKYEISAHLLSSSHHGEVDCRNRSRSCELEKTRSRSQSLVEDEGFLERKYHYERGASRDGRHGSVELVRDKARQNNSNYRRYVEEDDIHSKEMYDRERSREREIEKDKKRGKDREGSRNSETEKGWRREGDRERSRDQEIEGERRRERDRERSRDQEVDGERRRERDRERSRDREVDGERRREWDRERNRDREVDGEWRRERDRERSRDREVDGEWRRERDRERSRDREVDGEWRRERDRERSRDRDISGERRRERHKERSRDREIDGERRRQRDRERGRDQDIDGERGRKRDREGSRDWEIDGERRREKERGRGKDMDVDREKRREKEQDRSWERASDRDRRREKGRDWSRDIGRDREEELESRDRDRVSGHSKERERDREIRNDRNRDKGIDIDSNGKKYKNLDDDAGEHGRYKHPANSRFVEAENYQKRMRKDGLRKSLQGNGDKLKRDEAEQADFEESISLKLAEQEEEDLERIKEESRKRRQAILEKYKHQQSQQQNESSAEEKEKDQGLEGNPVQTIHAPTDAPGTLDGKNDSVDINVSGPLLTVGKSPSQDGIATLETTSRAAGLGEGTPKSERSDDMFCDDIFGESPAGVRKLGKGDGLPIVRSGLHDNWDDAEGYYSYRFGELLDGRYEVAAAHGKGVFSTVVRAKDLKAANGEPDEVAIKIIRNNETMHKAGQSEVQILKKLAGADPENKRHCVRFLSSFKYRNHLCLVFESLHMNLREVLKKFGRNIGLKLTAVRAYAKQLFIALKHLKNCGVLHCDIKPDNMLVNEAKNVLKLCDFGNAMFAGKNEITPYLVSRFYRAPEIILGLSYDHPMDMWSVGCCLYELYTGKVLFPGPTNNDMLRLHMELKGPFPKKMLRKGAFSDQHFDQDLNFHATEDDPVTKKTIKRIIINIKPKDIGSIIVGSPGEDPKMLANFKDILEKIFVLDPEKRMTVSQALSHPFITGKALDTVFGMVQVKG